MARCTHESGLNQRKREDLVLEGLLIRT